MNQTNQSLKKSRLKDFTITKILKLLVIALSSLTIAVYSANFALVHFTAPANERNSENYEVIGTFDEIEVRSYKKLKSGGLEFAGSSIDAYGYVNLFKPEKCYLCRFFKIAYRESRENSLLSPRVCSHPTERNGG